MKNYLLNWNILRFLHLVIGITIIVNGIITHEWIIALFGGIFTLMAILNVNTCATGNCAVPKTKRRI
ncbi:MAG TPA: hypothetical protein DCQ50_04280 [Chryseobacterium sp.]|nr:hypothetical protein [Chryseobacterium sp.]